MKRAIIFILLGMSVVICKPACGQTCSFIKGQVIDAETQELLPGANVFARNDPSRGTSTNESGYFELAVVTGDTLVISYIGFIETIVIVPDNCTLTIHLHPTARKMDDIVIQAERTIAEEFTVSKLRKLDVYTNPSAKADPILAVNSLPSATTTDESANISLRGGSPAETGIFLNNVPINDAVRYSQLNGIGTFSIFNTALINSVRVYPGNPPLEYGNSTSGIIALQTDEVIPDRNTNTISLTLASVGLFTSRKLTARSSLTAFSNSQMSGPFTVLNRKSLNNLKSFASQDLGLHYFKQLGRNAALKIFNYALYESYRYHYRQPTDEGTFHQKKMRNFTVANFRKRKGQTEFSANQGISFSQAHYQFSTMDINLGLKDLFTSLNIHHYYSSGEWKTGVTYDRKASDFDGVFPLYYYAFGEQFPTTSSSTVDKVTTPEWYVYSKHYLNEQWIIGAGIRKNLVVGSTRNFFSYQGNITYKVNDNFKVIASSGKYHKYELPQSKEADPYLLKSTQHSVDASYSKLSREFSASFFLKETATANSMTGRIAGLELFTRHKLTPELRCQISVTSLKATTTTAGVSTPSPYNIHYFVRGNFEYKVNGTWTFTLVYLFRQGSYYHDITEASLESMLNVYVPRYAETPTRLPAYRNIDISASKIFMVRDRYTTIAFASLGNVMNFTNVRGYTYNADYTQREEETFSQRVIYFGVILNFQ